MAVTHHLLSASGASGMRLADQTSGIPVFLFTYACRVATARVQELRREFFSISRFASTFILSAIL
ncbi:MAG: hypothetical protein ACK4L4_12585 [Gemmobacter sp.]